MLDFMTSRTLRIAMAVGVLTGVATADRKTSVTIWAPGSIASSGEYGGGTYGGYSATTGAFVTEQREVEVGAGAGEVRVNVPATIDAASVHVRDLTDPQGVAITEQRFVPAARTPTEMILRHVGEQVTVITTKGEVIGTLRAVDESTIVVEANGHLSVMRREGYVQDIRLPATGGANDKPTLAWRLSSKKPGKHQIEIGYKADNLAWSADYTALLDETGTTMDFRAWATLKNQTGGAFEDAQVTLVSGSFPQTPQRFTLASPVRMGANENVQVELVPAKIGIKPRAVVAFEAMIDPSADYQAYPNTDCSQYNGQGMDPGISQRALDIELPAGVTLPPGHVRLFQKQKGGHVDVLTDEEIGAQSGSARIRLGPDTEITGERLQVSGGCDADEVKKIMKEKIEIKLENKAKRPIEVVAREYMWRSTLWHLENEKTHPPGQVKEFRTTVPANGKSTITYTVVYTWN